MQSFQSVRLLDSRDTKVRGHVIAELQIVTFAIAATAYADRRSNAMAHSFTPHLSYLEVSPEKLQSYLPPSKP